MGGRRCRRKRKVTQRENCASRRALARLNGAIDAHLAVRVVFLSHLRFVLSLHFLKRNPQLNFAQQSYLKGAWNIKSSWGYYKTAAAELAANASSGATNAPELVCACKCGTGFFNLMVSLLPPTIVTIASWIGFSGDRDQGLEDLRDSVRSDQSMSPFAAMMLLSYLCGISAQVGDCNAAYMEEARALLNWVEERYPKSIIFSWVKVRYLRTNGQLREAIECAQEAVDNGNDFPVLNLFSYFQQGWCAFLLLEMRNSAAYFDRMLQDESSGAKNAVKAAYAYHAACALSIDSYMRTHDLLPASSALPVSKAMQPSEEVESSSASGKNAEAADSGGQQAPEEEDNAERIRTYLLNTPKYLDPKRGARDIETYSIRRVCSEITANYFFMQALSFIINALLVWYFHIQAKERLSGLGHPVLDGLELMYIFACFDSMPIAVAESISKLLDRVEAEMGEQRQQSIAESAAASSGSAKAVAASKYSFWPFSGSASSSASSTSSSSASVLAWPVADTARRALIRGCICSALKQSDGALFDCVGCQSYELV